MRRNLLAVALVLFSLDLSAAVSGYVLDSDGKPIAGARVRAIALETTDAQFARLVSDKPEPVPIASVETDAKGAFRVETKKQPVVTLLIDAPGRNVVREDVADGDTPSFILRTVNTKKGRITAAGKPLPNAWVVVNNAVYVRTDEKGEYAIPEVPRNAARMYVIHPDFAILERVETQDTPSLDFSLSPGTAFTGRVVDAGGRPVANAIVRSANWPLAKSGEDGSFTIAHLDAKNAATLYASIDTRTGTIKGDTITLRPSGTVVGVVRSTKDELPVAGMRVTARLPSNSLGSAITDAKGAFELNGVPAGAQLVLSHPAFIDAVHDSQAADGRRAERALTASPYGRVTGTVVDDEKKAVAGATISINAVGPGTAVSAPDGAFSVRLMPNATTLQVSKPSYPGASYGPVRVSPGDIKSGVRIVMARGKSFEIVLVDPSGVPLAGERVMITRRLDTEDRFSSTWIRCSDTADPNDTCRTNAEGKIAFKVTEGVYDVRAGGENTVMKELRAQKLADEPSPMTIELERGAVVEGRVTWSDGTPLTIPANVMAGGEFASAGAPVKDGAFVMRNVPAGKVSLTARTVPPVLAESDPVDVTAPASGVVIKLPRLGRIEGRVVERENNRPVHQFTVATERRGSFRRGTGSKSFTADDGRFVLEDVAPGSVDVSVSAPGFVRATASSVEVPEGKSATVEVSLERGGTVAGRVTAGGRPVSGAMVSTGDRERRRGGDSKQTDANGDYLIDTLPTGSQDLIVRKEGYVSRTITVNVTAGKETRGDVELSRGRDVTGRVVDTAGRPVAGAEVMFNPTNGGRAFYSNMQQSDSEGMFRLEGLADEPYTVIARKSGYVEASADITPSTPSVTLTLSRGGTLSGRVSGLPPAELSNVEVAVMSRGGSRTTAAVDATGGFTLNGVADGDVTVTATIFRPRQRMVQQVVKVAGGSGPFVELDFSSGLVVRGRVTLRGQPLRGMVHLVPAAGGSPGSSQIQSDGTYEARVQTPGQYRFLVTMQNGPGTMEIETIDVRGEMEHDVEVRGGTLRARVTDAATGMPLPDATVTVMSAMPGRSLSGSDRPVDSSGVATFDFLAEARYTVRATKAGYATASQEVAVENGVGANVDLALGQAELVLVTVIDEETGAAADAFIGVVDAANRPIGSRAPQRDPGGAYRLWLGAGVYTLNVMSRTHEPARVQVTVPGTPTVLVKLQRKKG